MNTAELEAQISQAEAHLAAITGNLLADVMVSCAMGKVPPHDTLKTWLEEFGLKITGSILITVHRDSRPLILLSVGTDRPLPDGWVLVELNKMVESIFWSNRELNQRYRSWIQNRESSSGRAVFDLMTA